MELVSSVRAMASSSSAGTRRTARRDVRRMRKLMTRSRLPRPADGPHPPAEDLREEHDVARTPLGSSPCRPGRSAPVGQDRMNVTSSSSGPVRLRALDDREAVHGPGILVGAGPPRRSPEIRSVNEELSISMSPVLRAFRLIHRGRWGAQRPARGSLPARLPRIGEDAVSVNTVTVPKHKAF